MDTRILENVDFFVFLELRSVKVVIVIVIALINFT